MTLLQAARRRAWLDALAIGAPLALAAAALGWRALGVTGLVGAGLAAALLAGLLAWRRAARLDARRLAARLDAAAPALEDSAELLFRAPEQLQGLALLQRQRLEARLAAGLRLSPRAPWSIRSIAGSWAGGLVLAGLLMLAPGAARTGAPGDATGPKPAPLQIEAIRLRITPPAYTGLPVRDQSEAEAKLPAGARLEWAVRFSSPPTAAHLVFADGARIPLEREANRWRAARVLEASTLYRIEAAGAPQEAWRRLEVTPDAPPLVAVLSPAQRLSTVEPGQTRWTPVFEATDDYGLEASARLRVTLASGEGEQIAVTRRETVLRGTGEGRRRRWSAPLDLAREGLTPGADLIVQLVVRDNRRPAAQEVEGPSLILRRLSEAELADGLDGLLAPTLPAFFRSQRQIILDAEALVRARKSLAREVFLQRSNALGADQAALRLRYGQFLGEEAEGAALPTADAPPPPTSDAAEPEAQAHHAGDGHDHAEEEFAAVPEGNVLREAAQAFGHVHDQGDAATLFDDASRSQLARALDAMWGSERELRQARPEAALPYARVALEALKQAQQASRIYLRKTGQRLPPIDPSRRLGGKRAGVDPALPPLLAAPGDAEILAEAWRALEERPGAPPLPLEPLQDWALANRAALPDALGLLAAIDAVGRDPACAECRQALRGALWAAQQPTPTAQRRAGADAAGRRYLEALR